MSLFDRVQTLIKSRGVTIRQVERESGIANATIRKWETQNPSLDSLIKIAEYLQVSIDYLVFGCSKESTPLADYEYLKFEQGLTCDGSPLTDTEADMIAMFRLLPESPKEELFDLVYFKYKRHVEDKKESIYSTYTDGVGQPKSDPENDDNIAHGIA